MMQKEKYRICGLRKQMSVEFYGLLYDAHK